MLKKIRGVEVFRVTMAAKITSKIGRSARDIADSAVHIRIHPRPQNLAESRQVLRVLEQFGEVVMYRHLKVRTRSEVVSSSCEGSAEIKRL